jgi:hypothetical protein
LYAQADQKGAGNTPRFCVKFPIQMRSGTPNEQPHEVAVEGAPLATALILFCQSRHIPLPANAEKALRLMGGKIGLVLTTNPAKVVLPQHGEATQ